MERPRDKLPSRSIELADGTPVRLHAIGADDAPALERFHRLLSDETTYLRHFKVHPELSSRELHRLTHVDHRSREALVATVHSLRWVRRYGGAGR